MFYHEVISPFGMRQSSRDFISSKSPQLTLEQRRLRQRQDEIRRALAVARNDGSTWMGLSALEAHVFQRLGEIRNEKRAEVSRVEGSKARWEELDRGFQSIVRSLGRRMYVPEEIARYRAQFEPNGTVSDQLLEYFEVNAEFSIDDAGQAWISLPLAGGEVVSTGLSTSQILNGDPRLAVLVLASVIDYNLYETEARREDVEHVEGIFRLFREASRTIGHQADVSSSTSAVRTTRNTCHHGAPLP